MLSGIPGTPETQYNTGLATCNGKEHFKNTIYIMAVETIRDH